MKSRYGVPALMWPSVSRSWPLRLASPSGDGSIVFCCMPSFQPGASCSTAFLMSSCAVIVKRAS